MSSSQATTLLFDTLDRDRDRFGAFVRERLLEISDEDLEAFTDGAARRASWAAYRAGLPRQ